MSDRIKCRITDVQMKDSRLLMPIIASFQHGTLLPEETNSLICSVSANQITKKRAFKISTDHSRVVYKGSDSTGVKSFCTTMIAICNRKTNKIRLVETESVLFSPALREEKNHSLKITLDQDKHGFLQKSFGSKSVRRRTEQMEKSKTDVSTLQDKLVNAVADVNVNITPININAQSILPPCNRHATSVENVYDLYDLITKEELDSMEKRALYVKENVDSLDKTRFTEFFNQNLLKILARKDEIQLQCLEILLYIDCILKFFSSPNTPRNLKSCCPYSQVITDKITKQFTLEGTSKLRLRPQSMRDKAACHVIVLCFLLLNFKFDLLMIAKSCKEWKLTKLTQFTKALGGTVVSKGSDSVHLKLPLSTVQIPLADPKKGMKKFK